MWHWIGKAYWDIYFHVHEPQNTVLVQIRSRPYVISTRTTVSLALVRTLTTNDLVI